MVAALNPLGDRPKLLGPRLMVIPARLVEFDSVTVPANPFKLVRETVVVPVAPTFT